LQADASRLADKWTQSGLLEGYTNEIEKNNMAMILENQAKQIVSEGSSTNSGGASFNTAGGGEQWAGVALPLVRKVFAQIAAKDFVSVQPMNLPSGLVFYLDFKYGTAKDGFGSATNDNMYGNVTEATDKMDVDEDVSGGLYGAGKFGYSINSKDTSAAAASLTPAAALLADINYDEDLTLANFEKVSIALPADADKEGVRAFSLALAADNSTVAIIPKYTKIVGANVVFVTAVDVLADATSCYLNYHAQPTDNTRGDFEDSAVPASGDVSNLAIPEINVELASEAIVAKTRKLKAQ